MRNLKFYGYHGVFEEEQENGQYFHIDAELYLDLMKAGKSDELKDSIDYSQVFEIIRDITENKKFRLLEKLAESISGEILSRYKEISKVILRVKKPEAPIDGEFDWVGVEITRSKNE